MRTSLCSILVFTVLLVMATTTLAAENARVILDQAGVKNGLCLHLACGQAGSDALATDLAAGSEMLVHGLALDDAACTRVRAVAEQRGLLGQVQVEKLTTKGLPYVSALADLLVVENATALKSAGIGPDELDRVLAPGGVRMEKSGATWKKTVKPYSEARAWTHPMGGPDGSRVAAEPVPFPVGLRWQDGLPLNIVHWASVRSYVAAEGRVFSISMTESENLLTTPARAAKQQWLVARSAASGLPLWKLPLGSEDPKSDLNTLNTLPLATDGKIVLAVKDKKLVAIAAASGKVERTFPVTCPTERLLFASGVAVSAGWESVMRKTMWDPATKPANALWDVRFGADKGAVEAFDAATGKQLWNDPVVAQQVLATDDTAIYLVQGPYPVKEQAVVARTLKTGEVRWRTPHTALGDAADLFLFCLGKDTVVLGRHKPGTVGAGVGCRQIVVLSLADGKKRWEANGDGGPMALFVGDELWYGNKRYEPATGKVLGNSPLRVTAGMCVPPMLMGDVGGTPRGGDWVDVKTNQKYRSGGVRGSCVQGAAATDGRMYVAQNWCRCAPAQVPGFVALGTTTLPTDAMFSAQRPVENTGKAPPAPTRTSAEMGDWPTFRYDADRSGACPSNAPTALPLRWKASPLPAKTNPLMEVWNNALAPRLSAPVAGNGSVYLASCNQGEIVAYDLNTGRERWRATTGARIDSPPTLHEGLCLTGGHDGFLYAFAYDTGKPVWRTRIAPEERRSVAFGQVESSWPVIGSPLIVEGTGYVVAGRSTEMEGGCALVAFDPKTGQTRWGAKASSAPGRRCDVLAFRDGALEMQCWQFDPTNGKVKAGDAKGRGKSNLDGLLDGSWARLGNRRSGNHSIGKLTADVAVWSDARYYGFGQGHKVFAIERAEAEKDPEPKPAQGEAKKPAETKYTWTWNCPKERQVEALALASNALVAVGRVWNPDPAKMQGFLMVFGKDDGRVLVEAPLPAAPVSHGVCVVPGRIIVALEDGTVACFGQ